jgi:uncharacterized membrane protein
MKFIEKFTKKQEREIGLYFHITILIKGFISLVEVIAGILILFVPISSFTNIVVRFAQGELAEEPGDFIATHLITYANEFALASGVFVAVYLLSRGLIKVFLIVALLKDKLWAYPVSIAVLGVLIGYQMYQIATEFSGFLILLTIFDLVVVWLVWEEYKVLKSHRRQA